MDLNEVKEDLRLMAPEFAKRVQPVYESLRWTWGGGLGQPAYIPSVEEIERSSLELIESIEEIPYNSRSGGIKVVVWPPNKWDLCGEAELVMEISSSVYYGEGGKSHHEPWK